MARVGSEFRGSCGLEPWAYTITVWRFRVTAPPTWYLLGPAASPFTQAFGTRPSSVRRHSAVTASRSRLLTSKWLQKWRTGIPPYAALVTSLRRCTGWLSRAITRRAACRRSRSQPDILVIWRSARCRFEYFALLAGECRDPRRARAPVLLAVPSSPRCSSSPCSVWRRPNAQIDRQPVQQPLTIGFEGLDSRGSSWRC